MSVSRPSFPLGLPDDGRLRRSSVPDAASRRRVDELHRALARARGDGHGGGPPRRRGRRIAARVALGFAAGLGLSTTFAVAFVASLLGHVNAPAARRAIERLAGDEASANLKGRIAITHLRHVGVKTLDLGHVAITDPRGATVLEVDDVRVDYDLFTLVPAFLEKGATPTVDRVAVRGIHVRLVDDGKGSPTLGEAFQPRVEKPTDASKASTLRLAVDDVELGAVIVDGTLARTSYDVQARLRGGWVVIAPDAKSIGLGELRVASAPIAGTLRTDARVLVHGAVRIPALAPPTVPGVDVPWIQVRADLGGVEALADGSFVGGAIDARVRGRAPPDALAALTGAPPKIDETLELAVDVRGSLDRVEATADVGAGGAGLARARGWVDLAALRAPPTGSATRAIADGRLTVRDLRAQALAPSAPPVGVYADLSVRATSDATGTEVAIDGDDARLTRLEQAVASAGIENPFSQRLRGELRVATHARAHLGHDGSLDASGRLALGVERARMNARFHYAKSGDGAPGKPPSLERASVAVRGSVPSLSSVLGDRVPVKGALDVDVAADADLAAHTFLAKGRIGAREIVAEAGTIPELALDLDARGSFDTPSFDARLAIPKVQLASDERGPGESLQDVVVTAHGTPEDARVTAQLRTSRAQDVALATSVVRDSNGVHARDLHARVVRGRFDARLDVKSIATAGGALSIQGLRLASTAGGLRFDGTVDRARHRYDVDLASTPIDVAQLADGLAIDLHGTRGFVTVRAKTKTLAGDARVDLPLDPADDRGTMRVDLTAPRLPTAHLKRPPNAPRLTGWLRLDLKDAWVPELGDVRGHVHMVVDDRLVEGGVQVAVKDLVDADLRVGGAVAGRVDDVRAVKDAIGHVDLSLPDVDLGQLDAFLGKRAAAAAAAKHQKAPPRSTRLGGHAALDGRIALERPGAPPEVALHAKTKGLALASGTNALTGVDVVAGVSMERGLPRAGEPDPVQLALDLRAFDRHGTVASFSSGFEAAWSKLQALAAGTDGGDRRWLFDHPLRAALVVPRRPVRELPAALRRAVPFDGTLSAKLALDGTFDAPRVRLDATLDDVHGPKREIDVVDLRSTYDGRVEKTHLAIAPRARPNEARFVADAEVALDERAVLAPSSPNAELPWTAKLDVKMRALPLALFPQATAAELGGDASGELHVAGVHDPNAPAPTAKGAFTIDHLALGADRFDRATLDLHADAKAAGAKLTLRGPAGTADLALDAPLAWQRALVPSLAPQGAATARVTTKQLRLKGFEALVTPLDELDGKLDVDVRAAVRKNANALAYDLGGTAHLDGGVVVVDAIGDRWKNVGADVAIGHGKVDLKKLHLEGVHGKADASGAVTLNGLAPKDANLQLSTDRFPVSTSGVPVGDLSGKVKITGDFTDPKLTKLDVTVTPMTVDLAPSSDKKPQELANDPTIVVYQPIQKPQPVSGTGGNKTAMKVSVHMPDNVWIRRDDLRLAVLGDPTLDLGNTTRLSGEVRVDRGWAEVLGKRFTVDHAVVRFTGGTDLNPQLDIAVKWDAPDGSVVTVAVGQYLKTPKVTMTADPPASQAEIMSLLALGRRDAGSATQQQQADKGAASQTAALVQGFTGAIVGKQLQKILPPEMSLSFQPGDQGFANAKYAAGYQYKDVYFDVGYDAGAQQQATLTAQSQPRTTFGVEWRFEPTWSLMTTLGDTGSAAVDLLWHWRY